MNGHRCESFDGVTCLLDVAACVVHPTRGALYVCEHHAAALRRNRELRMIRDSDTEQQEERHVQQHAP